MKNVLYFVGFALMLFSSLNKVVSIPLSLPFGLLSVLPPLFWIGFILMLLSMLSGADFEIKAVFMFTLIWSLPALFENSVSVWDSFFHAVNAITLSGYDWQGFYILFHFLFKITPMIEFLRIYRIFAALLFAIVLLAFSKKISPGWKAAFLLALFFCPYHQFHFSPQSFAISVSFILLLCLFLEGTFYRILYLTCGIYLAVSHPPNFIITVTILGCLSLFELIFKGRLKYAPKRKHILLFLLVYLFWLSSVALNTREVLETSIEKSPLSLIFYKNQEYFASRVSLPAIDPASANESVGAAAPAHAVPAPEVLTLGPKLRFAGILAMLVLDMVFLLIFRSRLFEQNTAFLMCSLAAVIFILPFVQLLSLNFLDRILLYLTIFSAFAVGCLCAKDRRFYSIAAAICIVMFMTFYYQEALYITSQKHQAAGMYIIGHIKDSSQDDVYSLYYLHPGNIIASDYLVADESSKGWYIMHGLHRYNRIMAKKFSKNLVYAAENISIYS